MPKPNNPWTTLNSRVGYENPWIRVVENEVLNPSGGEGIYGVVHFKNIATGVLPLDDEGNTWLVGQYRYPLDAYSWEIPEGGCPADTDPLIAVQRELKEETGITATQWQKIQTLHLSNSVCDEIAHLYVARELTFGDSSPEDVEELAVRKLPFSKAYRMVQQGEITDGMSVAAIYRVQLLALEVGLDRVGYAH